VPFIAAIATSGFFISTIFTAKAFFPTIIVVGIAFLVWYWPKWQPSIRRKEREVWEQ
jgi:hypothetical protein